MNWPERVCLEAGACLPERSGIDLPSDLPSECYSDALEAHQPTFASQLGGLSAGDGRTRARPTSLHELGVQPLVTTTLDTRSPAVAARKAVEPKRETKEFALLAGTSLPIRKVADAMPVCVRLALAMLCIQLVKGHGVPQAIQLETPLRAPTPVGTGKQEG